MFTIREKKPMLNPAIVSEQMQVKYLVKEIEYDKY